MVAIFGPRFHCLSPGAFQLMLWMPQRWKIKHKRLGKTFRVWEQNLFGSMLNQRKDFLMLINKGRMTSLIQKT